MIAVAVKFTAILLLPFLLIGGASTHRRRVNIVRRCGARRDPARGDDLALFGLSLPNLVDQSTLLTPLSVPNMSASSSVSGAEHRAAAARQRRADRGDRAAVAPQPRLDLRRRLGDARADRGARVAVPWYVIWLLPLAALGEQPAPGRRSRSRPISCSGSSLDGTFFKLVNLNREQPRRAGVQPFNEARRIPPSTMASAQHRRPEPVRIGVPRLSPAAARGARRQRRSSEAFIPWVGRARGSRGGRAGRPYTASRSAEAPKPSPGLCRDY